MSLAEYKAKLLGYKRSTPKTVRNTEDLSATAVPASIDWTT
jgi:hypothetical protein